jgi:3-deoxy-manno-octulosonate cytidylyltransferase (CMP-KDO synthetase)
MTAPSLRALAIIPARLASTRLPEKALLPLDGRPIVQWAYDAAMGSGVFDEVVVATDDPRIEDAVHAFGGSVVMTDTHIGTGSERVAAAAAALRSEHEVVVNVQGDQPFVSATMLRALVSPFVAGRLPEMTTLSGRITHDAQLADPNVVKVVTTTTGRALYFSRSPIPNGADVSTGLARHHIGLYAFRRDFLDVYAQLAVSDLEVIERLEQLRVLAHGFEIVVCDVEESTVEINTRDDYEVALRLVASR